MSMGDGRRVGVFDTDDLEARSDRSVVGAARWVRGGLEEVSVRCLSFLLQKREKGWTVT